MLSSPNIVKKWEEGWRIDEGFSLAADNRNHPSMANAAERVAKDWDRLASLGKIQFFERGAAKPRRLHVNPAAAILKDRPGYDPDLPEEVRTKLRIIVDLKMGLVNLSTVSEDVDFSSVEKAVDTLAPGHWIFALDLTESEARPLLPRETKRASCMGGRKSVGIIAGS